MSVTAEIETRSRTNVLTVPIQSVTTRLPKAKDQKTNAVASVKSTNAASASAANSAKVETNLLASATNDPSTGGTNIDDAKKKKAGEPEKPIEVVFLIENGHVKMKPVKRGISDDAYVEITEGLDEGAEVVSGGYKAINRELEDGKAILLGALKVEGESK